MEDPLPTPSTSQQQDLSARPPARQRLQPQEADTVANKGPLPSRPSREDRLLGQALEASRAFRTGQANAVRCRVTGEATHSSPAPEEQCLCALMAPSQAPTASPGRGHLSHQQSCPLVPGFDARQVTMATALGWTVEAMSQVLGGPWPWALSSPPTVFPKCLAPSNVGFFSLLFPPGCRPRTMLPPLQA